MDASAADAGGGTGTRDAGTTPRPDAGLPTDAGRGEATTCEPCTMDADCAFGFWCAELGTGSRACLPVCEPDIPTCPERFECVVSFSDRIPDPVCAPVGERCCVDPDGDLHGDGIGCLGIDCNEDDRGINSSGTETCDGIDEDCDGRIDEGDPGLLCVRGSHVAASACVDGGCAIAACEPGWSDCNGDPSDGCETSLATETSCGGCGIVCELPHATASCDGGTCRVATCESGWGDCNGDPSDGCETELNTPTHCGGCGVVCALANATSTCATGVCAIEACDPSWGDCDGRDANGCETPLTSNAHCGTCGNVCAPTSGNGDCSTGSCRVTSCAPGYEDCDRDPSNGCETSIRTLTDCGACGVACEFPNGVASCSAGACSLMDCQPGWGNCDGVTGNGCETPLDTPTSCGGCGIACAPPNAVGSCTDGTCGIAACNPGWADCDGDVANGCETSIRTLTDCGACGVACALDNAAADCSTGVCGIGACSPGFANCNGDIADGCETSLREVTSCGTCGAVCARDHATPTCASGTCAIETCDAGWANCDGMDVNGCETSLRTTAACGACGTVCAPANASGDCSSGSCRVGTCDRGWASCDGDDANGCETRLDTPSNCGACGNTCSLDHASATCEDGTCAVGTCDAGWGDCDGDPANGCETRLDTLTDCGACGTTCARPNAAATCETGTCQIAACAPGYANCDAVDANGCETSLRTLTDCGACGVMCSPAGGAGDCSTGTCQIATCSPGVADCDMMSSNGCETSLRTLSDCGACGIECARDHATATCATGTCSIASCHAGYGNCDGVDGNGCEQPLNTVAHCGSCGVECVRDHATATCAGGTCAIAACQPGWGNCDAIDANGCEQPLNTVAHCGGCGVVCAPPNAIGMCLDGTCGIAACNPGWGDCDGNPANGCEQRLDTLDHCGGCGITCGRPGATATCAMGVCQIASCNPGMGDCDGNSVNGCEQQLNTLSHCGGCGVTCSRANASASCSTGTCTLGACNSGYASCDDDDGNGCERRLDTVMGSCAGAVSLGAYDGDTKCGFLCSSNNGWTTFATRRGYTSAWFKARVVEDSVCSARIEHRIRLTSPPGTDFDLYVYRSCTGSPVGSSTRGEGQMDEVVVSEGDSSGSDDDFDYWIEVRFYSGSSCDLWTLEVAGHNC